MADCHRTQKQGRWTHYLSTHCYILIQKDPFVPSPNSPPLKWRTLGEGEEKAHRSSDVSGVWCYHHLWIMSKEFQTSTAQRVACCWASDVWRILPYQIHSSKAHGCMPNELFMSGKMHINSTWYEHPSEAWSLFSRSAGTVYKVEGSSDGSAVSAMREKLYFLLSVTAKITGLKMHVVHCLFP